MTTAYTYGAFDFGLSEEQEERAARLHRESCIVDLTFQGPGSPDVWTAELEAELDAALSERGGDFMFAYWFLLEKALAGEYPEYRELYELSGATAGITEASKLGDREQLLQDALRARRMFDRFPWARRAFRAADVRAAKADGEVALWGMCQFNYLQPGQLDQVNAAHELGLMDTCELAYNQMTFIGCGCTERYDAGLSHFGQQFVRRCNGVGVIVDTSHSGRQTTLDACQASSAPVVATHTSAAALYRCDRAKSDEELRAVAATGGVIGIVCVPFFLAAPGSPGQTIELVLDHVDYVSQLVGVEHVGIGTDWPIALPHALQRRMFIPFLAEIGFREEHGVDVVAALDGFRDYRDLVNITRGLVGRGYSDGEIAAILGENFLRVFEQVVG
jgi:membrane dipeptidase